ncbi:MAG: Uma2 family endonuclease [Imperialibacter sp.]|uniref:Uma2 family endonuclease n=1 Tax=Imperialibacter sp. TaxID=2038411 RepID=UPI003A855391
MAVSINKNKKVTYADYLTWPDSERWEIIYGLPYNMSPAPSRRHQDFLTALAGHFVSFFKGKECKVYFAPFDVRLSDDYSQEELVENVVQPDLSVFCDKNKLDEKGAIGAPDLVVEILSPSTSKKDMSEKLLLYQKFEVKEYWVVDPEGEDVRVFVLDKNGRFYLLTILKKEETLKSKLFSGLTIPLEELFAE